MKKAIIIGATSGIGKGVAKKLADNNYVVGITGRRVQLLEDLKAENPNSYYIKTLDLTDIKETIENLEELTIEIGSVDMLIISSGIGMLNDELDFEIEKRTIDINVLGFTAIANWAFNYFEKQGKGHLVAITSVAGLRGNGLAPAYNASKSYQIKYLEGLRQKAEKRNTNLLITDVRPGFVDTDMAIGHGQFWIASVEKTVRQIFNAIEQRKKIVYVTKRWRLIALLLKLIPRHIYDKL